MASLRTQALLATMRRCRPLSRAAWVNVAAMRFKTRLTGKSEMLAVMAPASSFEMSSSALNSSFMLATAVSMRTARRSRSAGSFSERSCAANRFSACSGWRRSWLAAARKRDFDKIGRLQLLGALLHLALERRVGALQLGRHVVELLAQRLELVSRLDRDAMIERAGADACRPGGQRLHGNHHQARKQERSEQRQQRGRPPGRRRCAGSPCRAAHWPRSRAARRTRAS